MINFNKAPKLDNIEKYVLEVINSGKTGGDGQYTYKCQKILEDQLKAKKVLLTPSGTSALEIAAMLCNISSNDEVIMPAFTYVSTANAFIIRNAKVIFVDIDKDTMNIDTKLIEQAITERTKVITIVHYAGVSCDMDEIMRIAHKYKLKVIEDAAQSLMSTYKGDYLGTIGDFGCYSFHATKNYSMGEGGALVINNQEDIALAKIIRSNGTNRNDFLEGKINSYSWKEKGSSYIPSEILVAYLYPQLLLINEINTDRINSWNIYYKELTVLAKENLISLPYIPDYSKHNAHTFYIKCKDIKERSELIKFLAENNIQASFHYIPLHKSSAGLKYTKFVGKDIFTTKESKRLLRLPMYYKMDKKDIKKVCYFIKSFYSNIKKSPNFEETS